MIEDTLARQLHDKATRAGTLTEAERAHLEAWYEQQDQAEEALLASSTPQPPMTQQSLRGEVEAAVSRLGAVTRHIQALTDENEALRGDIAALQQRLVQADSRQAA